VSIIKSVPNLISYLHDFFWKFSQFLAIYFELFSSESKFNSEKADEWGPPVSHRIPRRARLSARHCHMAASRPRRSRALSALSGLRAGVPTAVPTVPPLSEPRCHLARARPDRAITQSEAVVAGPCPSAPTLLSTPSVRR
jgi:hypothetical protein